MGAGRARWKVLEGIEVYSGASQIPAQYNRTANGCGVILLWTR